MERAQLREADEECHLADGEVAAGQVLRRELVPKLIEDLSKRCVLCGQLAIQRPDTHLQLLCGVLRRRLAAAKLIFEQLPDPATEARRWRHFVHLIGGVPIEHRHERRVGPNTGEIQNRRVQFEDILARPKKDGRAEKAGVFACVGRSGVSEPNEGRYPVDAGDDTAGPHPAGDDEFRRLAGRGGAIRETVAKERPIMPREAIETGDYV